MLVSDLIAGSLRLIGAIASAETPAANESNDGLTALNAMLDSWNTQKLLLPSNQRLVFPLQAGKATYTIGSNGTPDVFSARPLSLSRASLLIAQADPTQALERPLEVVTEGEWQRIRIKGLTSSYPEKLYYEQDFPLGTIALWPVPNAVNSIALYVDQLLTQFVTTGDTVSLPPGYLKAIRYALAVELAPEYGITPSELVVEQALLSLQFLKNSNAKFNKLRCDPAITAKNGIFDWMTGEVR